MQRNNVLHVYKEKKKKSIETVSEKAQILDFSRHRP